MEQIHQKCIKPKSIKLFSCVLLFFFFFCIHSFHFIHSIPFFLLTRRSHSWYVFHGSILIENTVHICALHKHKPSISFIRNYFLEIVGSLACILLGKISKLRFALYCIWNFILALKLNRFPYAISNIWCCANV